jgi:hypothetical protein
LAQLGHGALEALKRGHDAFCDLQNAAKSIVFAISRSNAMNGLSSGSRVVRIIPLWQKLLIGLDAVLGLSLLALSSQLGLLGDP